MFQDFDFDVFEQELLKEGTSPESGGAAEEEFSEETAAPEAIEEVAAVVEEVEEIGEEGEPSASLAELYIKQDLFDEASTIYRKILTKEPSNTAIRQILEETLALQAYVEGKE